LTGDGLLQVGSKLLLLIRWELMAPKLLNTLGQFTQEELDELSRHFEASPNVSFRF
jgi:hypothetical protein